MTDDILSYGPFFNIYIVKVIIPIFVSLYD